ncbi:TetR/AcrR family transcriptional regulator [Novosphingobium sp. 9]|uniref:TetR/AcrR family transcriptional regulator n=1 Tax=Novosphingobium sp. 9 TaxID=2025349 RepID=UPI0021B5207B|nr:TetR/AcrR family transcriptional regulator [Novosphingobium sp. 9]
MRLFLERGFEATTLDDIAAAADVSRRSLFHYFGSKEEIVFSTKADFPALVAEAINRRPVEEPLLDMVENAFVELAQTHLSEASRDLARLIQDTPALSAGDQAKYEKFERVLAKALADRKERPQDDIECRVTAAAAIGILKLSTQAWLAAPETGPDTFGRAAFAALREVAGQAPDVRE